MRLYYFDTCIWLDLFEKRDKNRGEYVKKLVQKIIANEDERIICTNIVVKEICEQGYS